MDDGILGKGRHLTLVRKNGWEYVERPGLSGIVAIVAVTDQGDLILIEQYRPPVGRRVIEVPAGLAGDAPSVRGEPLEEAAHRELLEETGYRARAMEAVAHGTPSAGMSDEIIHFFRARGVRREGDGGGDASEDITVHAVPLRSVPAFLDAQVERGLLVDLKVYVALSLASFT